MKNIPMSPAESDVIASHGYDPDSQTMRVEIRPNKEGKGGGTYDYSGVPVEKYAAFTGAASHGSFFHKRIRKMHNAKKVR